MGGQGDGVGGLCLLEFAQARGGYAEARGHHARTHPQCLADGFGATLTPAVVVVGPGGRHPEQRSTAGGGVQRDSWPAGVIDCLSVWQKQPKTLVVDWPGGAIDSLLLLEGESSRSSVCRGYWWAAVLRAKGPGGGVNHELDGLLVMFGCGSDQMAGSVMRAYVRRGQECWVIRPFRCRSTRALSEGKPVRRFGSFPRVAFRKLRHP